MLSNIAERGGGTRGPRDTPILCTVFCTGTPLEVIAHGPWPIAHYRVPDGQTRSNVMLVLAASREIQG